MNAANRQNIVKSCEAYCQAHGYRFTQPRRHELEIIAAADKPVGAYDILEGLGAYIKKPKPPTAYRAIEFLLTHGFIHRIESLNAYILCDTDHKHEGSQFMICDACGHVEEAHLCHLPPQLGTFLKQSGFHLSHWNTELHGLCHHCHR
jgi:Fur family zinc uptake transcriptional regulator